MCWKRYCDEMSAPIAHYGENSNVGADSSREVTNDSAA